MSTRISSGKQNQFTIKLNNMKHIPIQLILLFTAILVLGACKNDSSSQNKSTSSVPQLIDRSERIQLGKEWDVVQNSYTNKKNAIAKNASDHTSRLELAQLFIKEARVTGEHGHYYPAALEMVDAVLASEDVDSDMRFLALLTKSGVQLSLHEFEDAKITGEKAIKLNNRNAQIYGVLVDAHVELGDYKKAIALADKMVTIKPDIRSYSRVAYLREIHGDVEGAKAALKLAVEAGYPGNEETAWAMLTLGELYSSYGDDDSAKKIYEQIIEMRKDYPFAVAALAELKKQKGKLKEAEQGLNDAVTIIPEVGFYTSLAAIYKEQDRKDEFEKIMAEIFLMLEDDVVSGHNMNLEYADIYLNLLDNPDKALEYLNIEYAKRPLNIDVNRMMAKVYLTMNEIDQTKTYAAAASITNSIHPDLVKINSQLEAQTNLF